LVIAAHTAFTELRSGKPGATRRFNKTLDTLAFGERPKM
jgi:hypothetical protein